MCEASREARNGLELRKLLAKEQVFMVNDESLLRSEERIALQQLAQQPDIDGQRAAALLALDEDKTQAAAAEESGLTVNQVRYIVK